MICSDRLLTCEKLIMVGFKYVLVYDSPYLNMKSKEKITVQYLENVYFFQSLLFLAF